MTKPIGNTFVDELRAADVTDWRFSWTATGEISFDDAMSQAERDKVLAVLDAHDATRPTTDMVDAIRDARLAAGFADAVSGKVIQTRPGTDDIAKLGAVGASAGLAVVMGMAPAPTFQLIAADNSVLELAAADAYALLNGRCMPWVSATILYANQLKQAIRAGAPPADLEAGWPAPS